MQSDTCGYEKDDGQPCQLPASRDDQRCHHHTDIAEQRDNGGAPKAMDDHKERIVFTAVGSGLKVKDQAALAQVSPDTLRRHACCLESLREPEITADDPCNFCESYAQAHARGAMEVLDDCRPEFVASASYGYTKREQHELMGEDGDPIETEVVIGGDEQED